MQLRAQPTVDAQELLVHDGSKGERTEGLHAGLVHAFRVLVLAFQLEGEVVGQVPALVISTQQPERRRIPDFQRPEIQDTLWRRPCEPIFARVPLTQRIIPRC